MDDDIFIFTDLNQFCDSEELVLKYCIVFAKYTLPLHGVKNIDEYMVGNMGSKTIFDFVTAADEAYAMWLFQHGYEFWKERNQDLRAARIKKKHEGTYLVQKKKWAEKNKNGYADCGISEEGMAVYKDLLTKTVDRRNNEEHMQLFEDCDGVLIFVLLRGP